MNSEIPEVQAGFRKGRGTRHQIANILWITKKAREFQKNIYLCFNDYAKAFIWVTINCGTFLKEMGIPNLFMCFLRNLNGLQKVTAGIRHGTTDWFKIRKVVCQAVYCHLAY